MTDVAPANATPASPAAPAWKTRAFWLRWSRRALVAWAALSLLLWLGGPPLLKRALPWAVERQLHLQASLSDIRINPLRGELRVDDLRIRDGEQLLVGAAQIRVNLSLASLWRGSISLDDIQLIRPEVEALIDRDGKLNLMKLVPPKDKEEPESQLRWAIDHFLLDQGRVHFRAEHLQPVVDVRLESGRIEVHDLRSYAGEPGQLAFSTRLDDEAVLTWRGKLDLEQMRSEGEITLADLPLTRIQEMLPMTLPVQVGAGRLGLRLPYAVAMQAGKPVAALKQAAVTLDGLAAHLAQGRQPLLTLPHLAVSGIDLAWPAQTVSIARVAAEGAQVMIKRRADGNLALVSALQAAPSRHGAKPSPRVVADGESVKAAPAWQMRLAELALQDWQLDWHDASTRPAVQASLKPLNLTLGPLAWPAADAVPMTLRSGLGQGRIDISGELDLRQPAVDLKIDSEALPLPLLQPYIAQQLAVRLNSGQADTQLQLHWDQAERGLVLRGDAGVRNLDVRASADKSRLLGAGAIRVHGLDVQLKPQQTRISDILVDGLFAQVLLNPQRQLNLAQLAVAAPTTPAAPAMTARAPAPAGTTPGMGVRIGKVTLRRSAMLFADQSMTPGFATGIEKLNGQITGLDSRDVASARVALKGVVAPAGEVSISGRMNPLASNLSLDMALQFRQLELSALTPYAARFAGYRIDRGKLDVDLRYKIQQRALEAENKVVLRQLRLGDKVDSPEAIGIPLKLAVAILRDVDDNIDIDLPLSGSLDNPEFAIGPIIWKTFLNLLTRAVTAPFSVIGSLVGGGDDLGSISFATGSSELTPAARENLGKLAQALTSRPALQLEVRGLSDAQADRKALQLRKVEAELSERQQGRKDNRIESLERFLRDVDGRSAVNRLRELSQVPNPQGRMELNEAGYEARLLDALSAYRPVPDSELSALARQRADVIVSTLMTAHAMPAERVFLLDNGGGTAQDGQIKIPLNLTAK